MKAKLLKKLRKECLWKSIHKDVGGVMMEQWILLQRGMITYHSSTEHVLFEILRRESMNDSPFRMIPWMKLWHKQMDRVVAKEYHKAGNND
jgi:hypothetical protein